MAVLNNEISATDGEKDLIHKISIPPRSLDGIQELCEAFKIRDKGRRTRHAGWKTHSGLLHINRQWGWEFETLVAVDCI